MRCEVKHQKLEEVGREENITLKWLTIRWTVQKLANAAAVKPKDPRQIPRGSRLHCTKGKERSTPTSGLPEAGKRHVHTSEGSINSVSLGQTNVPKQQSPKNVKAIGSG